MNTSSRNEVIPLTILIEKSKRLLTLTRDSEPALRFPIALGKSPEGHKQREGDGRTPQGDYYICTRNSQSKYHLSLGLSYPNPSDAAAGLDDGRLTSDQYRAVLQAHASGRRPPWDTPMGGFIMIHGGGIDSDWTAGCIALRNEDAEILFGLCPLGTPVRILP